jgi:hypothetical protein
MLCYTDRAWYESLHRSLGTDGERIHDLRYATEHWAALTEIPW